MGRLSAVPSRLKAARGPVAAPEGPDGGRPSARERGYTTRWDKASRAFLRANPLCLGCQAFGRVVPAQLTDHVVPHRGDRGLFWDRSNWQPACRWHHDVVKQKLEARFHVGGLVEADLRLDSAAARAVTAAAGGPGGRG